MTSDHTKDSITPIKKRTDYRKPIRKDSWEEEAENRNPQTNWQ